MELKKENSFGLSKKTNVAMAAITGITVVANFSLWQSVIATAAISLITCYQLTIQGKIDMKSDMENK